MLLELIVASAFAPITALFSLWVVCSLLSSRGVSSVNFSATLSIVCVLLAVVSAIVGLGLGAFGYSISFIIFGLTLTQAAYPLLTNNANRGQSRAYASLLALIVIAASGLALLSAVTRLGIVLAFELMLFGALALLRITSKAERGVEALTEMYLWSVVGSFALVSSLFVNSVSNHIGLSSISGLLTLVGFAVKVPLWPFSSWLLKAHVEASTEFSILLSGYLVKFGVIGLYRALVVDGAPCVTISLLKALAWAGILESCIRLYSQVDLKRLIATLTILETNWLALCLSSESVRGLGLGLSLVLVHCWTTTTEFYMVELIYRRYSSRSLLRVSGVWWSSPSLARFSWAALLVTLGLPGTSIFALKFMFMAFLATTNCWQLLLFSFLMLVLVPISLVRVWVPVLCGQQSSTNGNLSLTRLELVIFSSGIIFSVIVGFIPSLITL